MKNSIIEDILLGNFTYDRIVQSKQYLKVNLKFNEKFEQLHSTLNEEQIKILEAIWDLFAELEYENAITFYKEGLKTGFLLVAESLS